jgi:hypothetical protein
MSIAAMISGGGFALLSLQFVGTNVVEFAYMGGTGLFMFLAALVFYNSIPLDGDGNEND